MADTWGMSRRSLLAQTVLASARVRAAGAGLAIGFVARALFARHDAGLLPPSMAVVVILAGATSVVCFTLDQSPRQDRASLAAAARQAVLAVGGGILAAMHLPGLLVG